MKPDILGTLFLQMIIYSVIGWIYETTLCSVSEKRFINRGFLNGPYCPVYGCGAIIDVLILGKMTNPFIIFFLGVLLTCSLEYLTSLVLELLFHTRWWDYSERRFNLNGRVCLLGAVVFGIFSVLLILYIHPFISGLTSRLSPIALRTTVILLLICFLADCLVTLKGLTDFNEKLHELTHILRQRGSGAVKKAEEYKTLFSEKLHDAEIYSSLSSVPSRLEELGKKINYQERRMLRSFPKLKSTKYNDALSELKQIVKRVKKTSRREKG